MSKTKLISMIEELTNWYGRLVDYGSRESEEKNKAVKQQFGNKIQAIIDEACKEQRENCSVRVDDCQSIGESWLKTASEMINTPQPETNIPNDKK